jgi:ATP-binding cassette subfamily F protein 3
MIAIRSNNIAISFGEQKVLDKVSISIEKGKKVGIVGGNGAGKTTLLKILSGRERPDEGEIFLSNEINIGFLEQETNVDENITIYDGVLEVYQHFIDTETELRQLEQDMGFVQSEDKQSQMMAKYDRLSSQFRHSGGYEYAGRAKGILKGLGFLESEFHTKLKALSSGQRTRLFMARLLSRDPELLLLDEPTNHLDINAITWLESFLQNSGKTVVLVSHDRYFLDKVCDQMIELEHGQSTHYQGNFTQYLEKKSKDREIQERLFLKQQKQRERMEEIIEKQRQWNREKNIIAAESRIKALERMEKVEGPKKDSFKIKVNLKEGIQSGKDVLKVNHLTMKYGEKEIFKDFSFSLDRSERVFLMGGNGCGKTTLLKAVLDQLEPHAGEIQFGKNVNFGYVDQDLTGIDPNNTLYDELLTIEKLISQTQIRNTLSLFGFSGEDVFKKIHTLSGGEKSRVLLAKLLLENPNLIILDEPTNHLDISSKEALEESILDFEGTLLCVSHDRYFVKKLANRILFFHEGKLLDYRGDYESFLAWFKSSVPSSSVEKLGSNQSDSASCFQSGSKVDFLTKKEEKSKNRKNQRKVEAMKERINILEDQLEKIEEEMNDRSNLTDHVKLQKLMEDKEKGEEELLEMYEFLEDRDENK